MTEVVGDERTDQQRSGREKRRRRWVWPAVAGTVVVVAVVLVWFQPQKLFIDDRVDEAIPTAASPAAQPRVGDGDPSSPSTVGGGAEASELSRGEFVSLDHGTSGVARVIELADGRRVLRIEGLDTDNGPDLFVYLSANPANGDEGAFDDGHVNLGRLKGNRGDQNYDIPRDADLGRLPTVVIWCDRFNSAFGAAELTA